MLQPFLLVGVGGSGGKTLRALRHSLELRLKQEDIHEWPKAWQMLHIDSPTNQDGGDFSAPFLPAEKYFALVAPGTSYLEAHAQVMADLPPQFVADVAIIAQIFEQFIKFVAHVTFNVAEELTLTHPDKSQTILAVLLNIPIF